MTDPEALAALATECGAMVLGEPGTRQQYLMDLEQLAALLEAVELAKLPPLPY